VEEAFEYVHASLELKALNVEEPWIVNASKNFKTLKNEVHKLALSSLENEKMMWKEKKKNFSENVPVFSGNARFGEFLDGPEKLQIITNQMLASLSWVWRSPKWKSYGNSKKPIINEGSYVCEILAPLVNIVMSDLPVNTNIWGIWRTNEHERKGSLKSAHRPDYMVVAEIKNKSIEIGYLETGRPNSSLDKQLRDHNKLNRLAKDSITKHGWPKMIDVIHALLSFRTAIACTLRNVLYNTDDSAEMMSMDMSASPQTSTPTAGSPSQPLTPTVANTQSKINLLEEQNSKLIVEITELNKKYAGVEAENIE
ncbi:6012_t:CDS:2, partial [Gigaspora rosea]